MKGFATGDEGREFPCGKRNPEAFRWMRRFPGRRTFPTWNEGQKAGQRFWRSNNVCGI